MILKKFSFTHFKILSKGVLDFDPHINFILGNNGYGKTSLLESIHCALSAHSFSKIPDKSLVQYNEEFYQLESLIEKENISYATYLYFNTKLKQKKFLIDLKKVAQYQQLLSYFPLIYFTPFDIQILLGSPQERRRFFDRTLSYQVPFYYEHLKNYHKLIKEKNTLLRKNQLDLISTWNTQIVKEGFFLLKARHNHIETLNKAIIKSAFTPSWLKKGLNLRYTGLSTQEQFEELLEKEKNKEFLYKNSLIGPHRDDYLFYALDEKRLIKDNLSLGQTKLLAFYLKFLEIILMNQNSDNAPIFLIDDVFSELDDINKNYILQMLQTLNNQIFLTSTKENVYYYNLEKYNCIEFQKKGIINF
jgi:DNA replication and repair protein RecF